MLPFIVESVSSFVNSCGGDDQITFTYVFSGDEWQAQHEEDHQNSLQSCKEI